VWRTRGAAPAWHSNPGSDVMDRSHPLRFLLPWVSSDWPKASWLSSVGRWPSTRAQILAVTYHLAPSTWLCTGFGFFLFSPCIVSVPNCDATSSPTKKKKISGSVCKMP
jgi:hypothetical protein